MPEHERAHILEAIRRALDPVNEVRAALLFGSQATDSARPDSDIDVAVLLAADSSKQLTETEIVRRLLGALSCELAADRLDLVILNSAPPALAFQALKHGRVALERDPRDLHRFRVRTYSAHADYEHVERLFRAVTKQRALAGLQRG
jgi:predicted nucleotidyltransferase